MSAQFSITGKTILAAAAAVDYGEMAEYCPVCGASICLRKDGTFRVHGPLSGRCGGSGRLSQIAKD